MFFAEGNEPPAGNLYNGYVKLTLKRIHPEHPLAA